MARVHSLRASSPGVLALFPPTYPYPGESLLVGWSLRTILNAIHVNLTPAVLFSLPSVINWQVLKFKIAVTFKLFTVVYPFSKSPCTAAFTPQEGGGGAANKVV